MSDIPAAPRVAVGAVLIRGGKVLLVKRSKPPNQGQWAIPGGSVHLGETLREAAEREMREETGLVIRAGDPVHTVDLIERDEGGRIRFHYVIIDFAADLVGGELRASDDAADAGWFGAAEMDDCTITETTREFLKKVLSLPF
jgi:8-oxo-dGTP diphosphatase